MSGSRTKQRNYYKIYVWKRNETEEVREDLCLEAEQNRGSERRFMSGSGKKRVSERRFMSGSRTKQRK